MLIQNTTELPKNWKNIVLNYNFNSFYEQTKMLIDLHKKHIKNQEPIKVLIDFRTTTFIKDIIFNEAKVLEEINTVWSKLPISLIKNILKETEGISDMWEFSKKLDSIYNEIEAYEILLHKGFSWKDFDRSKGSCDLTMDKDNQTYNIEVKLKESEDVFKARIEQYLIGLSLLNDYSFLRGKDININLKASNLTNIIRKEITKEVMNFTMSKQIPFDGKYIQIYKGSIPPNIKLDWKNFVIAQTKNKEEVCALIKKIFLDKEGHLTKMKEKSLKYNKAVAK